MRYEFKKEDAFAFKDFIKGMAKEKGSELIFAYCPYCGGGKKRERDKFSINLKTGQFECKRASCGAKGNMITLSKDFDFSLGSQYDEYYQPKKQYRTFKRPEKAIEPKDAAIEYLKSRGISEEIAKKYEITIKKDTNNILVFPFVDEKGDLQTIKYRKTDFNKAKDKNKEWFETNTKPILFGMNQCSEKKDRLVITEGQLDSLSVAEAGIENAVSVPTGARGFTWVPYCWDWVSEFENIVVFGDYERGEISLLDEISKRFRGKVSHVRHEDYKDCKDANELLQNYGKESVRKAVENAIPIPVRQVIPLAEVENINVYDLKKLKTGMKEIDNFLYGGIPFGIVCLVAGKRGDGKSTFASQLLTSAIAQNLNTFIYSGELPNYLYKNWFDMQIAGPNHIIDNDSDGRTNRFITNSNIEKINNWYRDKAYIYDNRIIEADECESLLDTIKKAIDQYGIKVVLIDNLMTAMYIDDVPAFDKYDQQGRFVRELTKIALDKECLILLVAHRRKNNYTNDANDEVSGSGDVTNLAGLVMSYDRPSQKDIDNGSFTEGQRKLIISKNRLFGRLNLNGITLNYNEVSKRIFSSQEELYRDYDCKWDDFEPVEDEDIPY